MFDELPGDELLEVPRGDGHGPRQLVHADLDAPQPTRRPRARDMGHV